MRANSSRRRMFRFVKAQLGSAGQLDRAQQAPALVVDGGRLDAACSELLCRRRDVVAHQIQLGRVGAGVDGELGRRQGEDQPAAAGVDVLELQNVAEEGAVGVRVLREQDRVGTGDHARIFLLAALPRGRRARPPQLRRVDGHVHRPRRRSPAYGLPHGSTDGRGRGGRFQQRARPPGRAPTDQGAPMSMVTGVDFAFVPVHDFARAVEFYGTTLGLPLSTRYERMDGAEFTPSRNAIALGVEDVAAARAELEAKGVQFYGDTVDTGVCHQAYFNDPEGHALILHHRYAPR